MKKRFLIGAVILMLALPATSSAFAILKYTFDAIKNQLGFDRGPIPKVVPPAPPIPGAAPHGSSPGHHRGGPTIHIQAEGF